MKKIVSFKKLEESELYDCVVRYDNGEIGAIYLTKGGLLRQKFKEKLDSVCTADDNLIKEFDIMIEQLITEVIDNYEISNTQSL